jgi:hypothetical protein
MAISAVQRAFEEATRPATGGVLVTLEAVWAPLVPGEKSASRIEQHVVYFEDKKRLEQLLEAATNEWTSDWAHAKKLPGMGSDLVVFLHLYCQGGATWPRSPIATRESHTSQRRRRRRTCSTLPRPTAPRPSEAVGWASGTTSSG